MAHDGRESKIRGLRVKIKEAKLQVPIQRKLMAAAKFSFEAIKNYNKSVSLVCMLKSQLDYMVKYNKPKQYMSEATLPQNISINL